MQEHLAQFLLAYVLLGVLGCSGGKHSTDANPDQDRIDAAARPVRVCRIRFVVAFWDELEYRITDESKIQELVLEPLASAKRERHFFSSPPAHEILGIMTVETEGRVTDRALLFAPFGKIQRGDTYMVADFTKLKGHLSKVFKHLDHYVRLEL